MNFACVANNELSKNLNNIDNWNCSKASETILSSLIKTDVLKISTWFWVMEVS